MTAIILAFLFQTLPLVFKADTAGQSFPIYFADDAAKPMNNIAPNMIHCTLETVDPTEKGQSKPMTGRVTRDSAAGPGRYSILASKADTHAGEYTLLCQAPKAIRWGLPLRIK